MVTTNNGRAIQPYLFFDGRCEEALEFYRKTVGAEIITLMRFKDSPEPPQAGCGPMPADKIMHASFRVGESHLMASDGQCGGKPTFAGFGLSLVLPTENEAETVFAALTDGGKIQMPLTKTFFSARFGMVADRFGVTWMILVSQETPASK